MLVDQQEYVAALQTFGSVIEGVEMKPYISHADQLCYLSAAFNAALLSGNLQDFQGAERYLHILNEASNKWFGYPLQIRSHLISENSLNGLAMAIPLRQDSHAWGVMWICTKCGANYYFCPSQCEVCDNTSFYSSDILPPGAR